MAYTYDDFVSAAQGAGLYDSFSQDDLIIAQKSPEYGLSMLKLQQDANSATTPEQKLLVQEALNQLRTTYTGSATPTSAATAAPTSTGTTTASGYSYGNQDAYDKALQGVTGFGDYSYDKGTDPLFGQMKDSYLTDIDTAKDKLMGSQAVTGGSQAPSYAGAAAGQSGNYYGTRLNDYLPEAEQTAYQKYLGDFGVAADQLGAVAADKNFDYAAFLKQQELDMAAAQQQFANELLLHQTFGTAAPSVPDASKVGTGTDTAFTYGKENEFKEALDAVLNQEGFSYDAAEDPVQQSLRKSYLREGKRAGEDMLARASAGSMGVPSSYAIRVAADAENGYSEQLMGALPDMQGNQYERYLRDFTKKMEALGALETDRNTDYQTFLQEYQLEQQKKQQAFDNAMALYQLGGLTPEIAAILGVPYVAPAAYYDDDEGGGRRSGENVRQVYLENKKAGANSVDLDKYLKQSIAEGKISQWDATELRNERY